MADEVMTDNEEWNAARIEEALAHIERVQDQIDGLRTAIPSIIAPLTRPTTKSQALLSVRKAALSTTQGLKSLSETWTSSETEAILSHSKKSLSDNPNL